MRRTPHNNNIDRFFNDSSGATPSSAWPSMPDFGLTVLRVMSVPRFIGLSLVLLLLLLSSH